MASFNFETHNIKVTSLPGDPSQDGTDATGVVSPTGATGIRGWLSGIYNLFNGGTAKVNAQLIGSYPTEVLLTQINLDAGVAFTSAWIDTETERIAQVGLTLYSTQPCEVWLECSDDQVKKTRIFQGLLPASHTSGSTFSYEDVFIPFIMPKARYYRWVITNRGLIATTTLRVKERRLGIPFDEKASFMVGLLHEAQIRDTNVFHSYKGILIPFGNSPKQILIESSLDQATTITFQTARSPKYAITIGTYTVPLGTQETILTYADFPVLAGPLHLLSCYAQCSVAPTAGEINIGLVVSS